MFYVIRDCYSDYDYKIIAAKETSNEAMIEMIKDVVDYCNVDIDVKNVIKEALKDGYEDKNIKVWVLGALYSDVCRWGITEWKGKENDN